MPSQKVQCGAIVLTRRDFLKASRLLSLLPLAGCPRGGAARGSIVNDIHSQLNPTRVDQIVSPDSLEEIRETISQARQDEKTLCTAGGRHSMGGQQFATDALLIDTRRLNRVLNFDRQKGTVEVESGIQWPELVDYLVAQQENEPLPGGVQWGIAQKQTGADRLSLGGAIASNVHGRGLSMRPIIENVESFHLIDAKSTLHRCSRRENTELFRLVIGGYGLFGVVHSITLRLAPRRKLQRVVEVITIDDLTGAFAGRIREGFLYGDFQFAIDEHSPDFLREGVFSCYRPVPAKTPMPDKQKQASDREWRELVYLAHTDKSRAYQLYAEYYLSTSGQLYWSDTHQLSAYVDDYHRDVDRRLGVSAPATEVITEIFVPGSTLHSFMDEVRADFRKHGVNMIYGTIRLVERDGESFLAWARQPYACIIFNLHTVHTAEGQEHSAKAFRRLIDMAIRRGGSYYLTYHRHATRQQVETCYPQFAEFLRLKKHYDPQERFQSDWYRHYKRLFAAAEGYSSSRRA
jgi:FAD/FMN-containing dehydrogenase